MYEKGKISSGQLFILILIYMIGTSEALKLGTDSAIAILFAIPFGLLTLYLFTQLQRRYPGKMLFEYVEEILGKWPGKLVSLVYIYFALESCVMLARGFAEFIVSTLTPELSVDIYIIGMVIVAGYAVYKGIEATARFAQMSFPFYLFLFLFVNVLLIGQFRLENILPLWDHPPGEILYESYLQYVRPLGEVAFFIGLLPYVKKTGSRLLSPAVALVLIGLYLVYRVVVAIGTLGPTVAESSVYPYIMAIRFVKIGEFVERIDILFLGVYIMMVLLRFIVIFYTLTHGVAYLTRVKSVTALVFPLCFLVIGLAQIFYGNAIDAELNFTEIRSVTAPIFMLLLPALLLIISRFRQREREPANDAKHAREKAAN
jgi:spore germination protein KB